MIEHVKNYNITNLLLDSSQAIVGVEDKEYHALIFKVSMKIKETGLKKVARVKSNLPGLEKNAVQVQTQVLTTGPDTYQIKNFNNKTEAFGWLSEKALSF